MKENIKKKVIKFIENHYGKLICFSFWLYIVVVEMVLRLGEVETYVNDVPNTFGTSLIFAIFLVGVHRLCVIITSKLK